MPVPDLVEEHRNLATSHNLVRVADHNLVEAAGQSLAVAADQSLVVAVDHSLAEAAGHSLVEAAGQSLAIHKLVVGHKQVPAILDTHLELMATHSSMATRILDFTNRTHTELVGLLQNADFTGSPNDAPPLSHDAPRPSPYDAHDASYEMTNMSHISLTHHDRIPLCRVRR